MLSSCDVSGISCSFGVMGCPHLPPDDLPLHAHDGTPPRLPADSPRYRQLIAQHPDPVTERKTSHWRSRARRHLCTRWSSPSPAVLMFSSGPRSPTRWLDLAMCSSTWPLRR